MKTREPAVAGQFYPADPRELKETVDSLLESVPDKNIRGKIYGIIVPHAGYEFSGKTAAFAYKQLKGRDYNTVIVIGPSHQLYFEGASVMPEGYFKTPLGLIEVDHIAASLLMHKSRLLQYAREADSVEHSVEVQVPFLQRVLKNFKLVPIIMGNQSIDNVRVLREGIGEIARERNVLIVASSDLYHGYDYGECINKVDSTTSLIQRYDTDSFYRKLTEERDIACGGGPILACLLAARDMGATKSSLLYKTNSGDVMGMRRGYVVGYSSFVISGENEESSLSGEEKERLIELARSSITQSAKGEPLRELHPVPPRLEEKRGCFVTIKKYGKLRGCIGYILSLKPLYQAVSELAVAAALSDPRFSPVKEEELSLISIEISVLSPLKKIENPKEIIVGKHGLYIVKGNYSGLLLPQVATEYNMDRITFLEHTSRKAGLEKDAWREGCEIYVFDAEVFGEG
jgi:hypothetical protein